MNDKNSFSGTFFSGKSGEYPFKAEKNEQYTLPDPEKITYLKDGKDEMNFTFPNLQGEKISLDNPKYKNKVVIIQLLGTWCPNCMDETAYLSPWYKKNKKKGIEIIGLAYEKSNDFATSKTRLEKMIKRFKIEYDILLAGTNDKETAASTLPMLNGINAYPTTIFIDKKGKVRKIHTGFNGPATGKEYEIWQNDFKRFIDKLISE
jgi:thiol-disulfide isomerase/thioredoxin